MVIDNFVINRYNSDENIHFDNIIDNLKIFVFVREEKNANVFKLQKEKPNGRF